MKAGEKIKKKNKQKTTSVSKFKIGCGVVVSLVVLHLTDLVRLYLTQNHSKYILENSLLYCNMQLILYVCPSSF